MYTYRDLYIQIYTDHRYIIQIYVFTNAAVILYLININIPCIWLSRRNSADQLKLSCVDVHLLLQSTVHVGRPEQLEQLEQQLPGHVVRSL